MEQIRFLDHTKAVHESCTTEEAESLNLHTGTICGNVIREDAGSVTIAPLTWESNGDTSHEFIYVIIKSVILERVKA